MSPLLDHVLLGGGQEASAVTTTDHRARKFEAKFFDKILQEEIGGVKGHFGPINALAFNPDGKRCPPLIFHWERFAAALFPWNIKLLLSNVSLSFSSGGEDSYVRLHHFDPHYFHIKILIWVFFSANQTVLPTWLLLHCDFCRQTMFGVFFLEVKQFCGRFMLIIILSLSHKHFPPF